jgi:hypothetical protein
VKTVTKSGRLSAILFAALTLFPSLAHAIDCSGLPTTFTGNEFPTGNFFSNFQNPCYLIPMVMDASSFTDLNDTDWHIVYSVDSSYQLIVLGDFPNSRYFSVTAYDDHSLISQAILDTNIVPLTSGYVNPFQPGVPYAPGQQYALAVNFGGTPGTLETGCMMNGFNVSVNSLDATQRHQGMNWNTDAGFLQQSPIPPVHIVDTPDHTNPPVNGYMLARAYVDIDLSDPTTVPSVIVRDVASGCAYPAAYAIQTLKIVSTSKSATSILDQAQFNAHQVYNSYLPSFCYAKDPRSSADFSRLREGGSGPNPFSPYVYAATPANLPTTLATKGEAMRIRLRLPTTPPTPCTDGCSRSGNEQVRYLGLSFDGGTDTLASVKDSDFTQDAQGYATLIVGTGASIPSWITPANGYTFLDLTTSAGYQSLVGLEIREIVPSSTFACSAQNVAYRTTVYTSEGSLMGDYLPVVDYPLAATLPQKASKLTGPSSCGTLPIGVPATSPACGLLPVNPTAVSAIPAPAPGESPVAVQPLPPITLSGAGFGFLPNGLPFTGNSNYLQVTDLTQNWSAGSAGNPCNLSVSYWNDNRIEAVANVDQNGLCPLAVGDQLAVSIQNPQGGSAPVTSILTVGPGVNYTLGSAAVSVGSAAGNNTVELTAAAPWSAASNAAWLHLSPASASGMGSAAIQFSYDANASRGARTGTLTIAGLTFTVAQAGK